MSEKKKRLIIIGSIILAVILLIVLMACIFIDGFLSGINPLDTDTPTLSAEEIENLLNQTDVDLQSYTGAMTNKAEVVTPTEPADLIIDNDTINILLVGQDRRAGEGRTRSDAMILVTVNIPAKTLTMTSLMRDLWVQIPGYFNERLNVPYAIDSGNGFDLLNKTLEHNFGVRADHNVEVDFDRFSGVIDAVGGVSVYLTNAEAVYINACVNWSDPKNTNWPITEGVNHLNGEQALMYSRLRELDSDFSRTSRQRTVLNALFEKIKSSGFTELYAVAKSILPMLKTDMTDQDILSYALTLARILPDLTVVSQRIPADGAYYNAMIDGKAVLCMTEEDWKTNTQLLRDTLTAE